MDTSFKIGYMSIWELSMKMMVRGDGFTNNIMSNLYIYI